MLTTALDPMQQDLAHITCFMENNFYYLLILNMVSTQELSEAVTYKYVQELKSRLEHAFNKANDFCEREAIRTKQRFDKTAKCSKLMPGDLVLEKRKGFVTKHKIADKWETEPYEVISQHSDGLPVYTVTRNGRERILHRNMFFLLGL